MHHSAPSSSELRFLPAMYSFSGSPNLTEFDLGNPSTSGHLHRAAVSNKYVYKDLRAVKHLHTFDINILFGLLIDTSVSFVPLQLGDTMSKEAQEESR